MVTDGTTKPHASWHAHDNTRIVPDRKVHALAPAVRGGGAAGHHVRVPAVAAQQLAAQAGVRALCDEGKVAVCQSGAG